MGFGGSTQNTQTNSPWAGPLGNMGKSAWKIAQPLMSTLGSQFLEALKTGGVNSFIPWINRAVDASRMSASKGIEGLRQNLARSGQGNSAFGEAELSEANMQAGNEIANTPEEMIMSFIQGAPGFALGTGKLAEGAMAGAGGLQNTQNTQTTPGFWDLFMQGMESGLQWNYSMGRSGGHR